MEFLVTFRLCREVLQLLHNFGCRVNLLYRHARPKGAVREIG